MNQQRNLHKKYLKKSKTNQQQLLGHHGQREERKLIFIYIYLLQKLKQAANMH